MSPSESARAVIQFWCDELAPEQHWAKDPAMDRHIAERFGKLREEVLRTGAKGWRDTPETLAAAIILLDQFGRNMFRGQARAFEADPLALELCKEALAKGWVDKVRKPLPSFILNAGELDVLEPNESLSAPRDAPMRVSTDPEDMVILHAFHDQMAEAVAKFPADDWARLAAQVGVPVQRVRSPEDRPMGASITPLAAATWPRARAT